MKQNRFCLNRNAQEEGELWSYKRNLSGGGDSAEEIDKEDRGSGVAPVVASEVVAEGSIVSSVQPNFAPPSQILSGEAYARRTDPETSEQAAESVRGRRAKQVEGIVLQVLLDNPKGLTNHEIAHETGLSWNTCTPRIRPLVRKGLVVDSGERREGCTNRKCVVWKAT